VISQIGALRHTCVLYCANISSASGCLIRRKYQNAYLLIAAHKHVSCSPARGTHNRTATLERQTDTCANGAGCSAAPLLPLALFRMNSQLVSQQCRYCNCMCVQISCETTGLSACFLQVYRRQQQRHGRGGDNGQTVRSDRTGRAAGRLIV
jgi:hypothetical protein